MATVASVLSTRDRQMNHRIVRLCAAALAVLGLAACNGGGPPPPSEAATQQSLPGGLGPTDMTPDAPPD
jgi:hypothetical protein